MELETATGIPLVIVITYIPHFGRSTPSADDVYEDLTELMGPSGPLPRRAIKVVMGDFNGRLTRAYDFTGKKRVVRADEDVETEVTGCWSVHKTNNEMGGKWRDFPLEQDLVPSASYYQPPRKLGGAGTYIPFGRAGAGRKGATIDGICVSRRFKTDVDSCRVRWGPSEERWNSPKGRGVRKDHALLEAVLSVRMAKYERAATINRAALRT